MLNFLRRTIDEISGLIAYKQRLKDEERKMQRMLDLQMRADQARLELARLFEDLNVNVTAPALVA